MALPVQLPYTALTYGLGHRSGPFQVASGLYACLTNGTYCFMYKSTDRGETWNEMDAADRPSYGIGYAGALLYGTSIYLFKYTTGIVVQPFDTTTDQWGTATAAGGPTTWNGELKYGVRGAGSYVAMYNVNRNYMGGQYGEVRMVRYDGGSWQSSVKVDNETTTISCSSLVAGADLSSRAYLLYAKSSDPLAWKTLKADNTLSTESTLAGAVGYWAMQFTLNGSEIVFVRMAGSPAYMSVVKGTVGDALSLASQQVGDYEAYTYQGPSVCASNGIIYAAYCRLSDFDTYWTFQPDWPADRVVIGGITQQHISFLPVNGGIGYIYVTGDNAYYNMVSLDCVFRLRRRFARTRESRLRRHLRRVA